MQPTKKLTAPTPLFRQEVVEFKQHERQYGQVILAQPFSVRLTSWLMVGLVVSFIILLSIGQYSRKATVSGYLAPVAGTAKILALRRGTIIRVHVTEGQEVQEGQSLLTIDTGQISASGEDVHIAILGTLQSQRGQLQGRIAVEQERKASEEERLTELIKGLKTEIGQLEAQIPLQEERIKLSESLVSSIVQLAEKGTVTAVEVNRRKADVLDQRQTLNSINQRLSAQRNQLINTEYSFAQLPIVIGEKIQHLRNQLSSTEQRIAEIRGSRAFVIQAPLTGRVTTLQAAVGRIAEPQHLQLEIVPPNLILKVVLLVPSHAIGFVNSGQRVSLRYDAFPYQNFGRYAGTIVDVSQNILTASDTTPMPVTLQEPAYRVTATLDRQDIDAYGKRMPLQAGMLLKADVILDRRSLARWLFDPLLGLRG